VGDLLTAKFVAAPACRQAGSISSAKKIVVSPACR